MSGNRHARRLAAAKRYQWLAEWRRRGYTVEVVNSGHLRVRDPDCAVAAIVSSTPASDCYRAAQAGILEALAAVLADAHVLDDLSPG